MITVYQTLLNKQMEVITVYQNFVEQTDGSDYSVSDFVEQQMDVITVYQT